MLFPFSVAGFTISVFFTSVAFSTLIIWVGILFFVVFFHILAWMASVDLKLAAWVLREPAPSLGTAVPLSPWQVGIRGFYRNVCSSGILSSWAYFLLVHFPISFSFAVIVIIGTFAPLFLISSPAMYIFGVPGLCINMVAEIPAGFNILKCEKAVSTWCEEPSQGNRLTRCPSLSSLRS